MATYQFGRSPTNDSTQVFARRLGLNAIVTVPNDFLELWRAPLNQFRDPRVVSFAAPVDQIEFTGGEVFTVQRAPSNAWRIVQAPLPVDSGLVGDLIATLGNLSIAQFKDSITEADLPRYGLTAPIRQVVISSSVTNGVSLTNTVLANLSFGDHERRILRPARRRESGLCDSRRRIPETPDCPLAIARAADLEFQRERHGAARGSAG